MNISKNQACCGNGQHSKKRMENPLHPSQGFLPEAFRKRGKVTFTDGVIWNVLTVTAVNSFLETRPERNS